MIRRLALAATCGLLAACGSGAPKHEDQPEPFVSPSRPVVSVFATGPRPKALELPYLRILTDDEANLRWPHAGLHLDLIGATPGFDATQAQLIGVASAAPGEELVVAHVGTGPSGAEVREITDAVVKIGGQAYPVPPLRRDAFVVVSAPKEAIVRLEVTDTGRMQWVDLRTAETGNLIAGYYPRRRDGASIACKVHSKTKAVDGSTLVLMTEATLEPWVEGRGWAPPGRLWLVMTAKVWYSRNEIGVSLDGPTSVTLTGPEGPIPVPGTIALTENGEMAAINGSVTVTADVPSDTRVAQLAFNAHGTLTAAGAPVPAWTTTCETVQDAITFK